MERRYCRLRQQSKEYTWKGKEIYEATKEIYRGAGDVLDIIGKTLGSYLGVVSNIAGTIIGIFATVLVIAGIVGLCLYVKFLPMFTEARETVFDKLVNMSEDDFVMKEDTAVYDKDGKLVGSVNAGRYKYAEIKSILNF